jgi:hypothetical protein
MHPRYLLQNGTVHGIIIPDDTGCHRTNLPDIRRLSDVQKVFGEAHNFRTPLKLKGKFINSCLNKLSRLDYPCSPKSIVKHLGPKTNPH